MFPSFFPPPPLNFFGLVFTLPTPRPIAPAMSRQNTFFLGFFFHTPPPPPFSSPSRPADDLMRSFFLVAFRPKIRTCQHVFLGLYSRIVHYRSYIRLGILSPNTVPVRYLRLPHGRNFPLFSLPFAPSCSSLTSVLFITNETPHLPPFSPFRPPLPAYL